MQKDPGDMKKHHIASISLSLGVGLAAHAGGGTTLHWNCPGCKYWGTIKAIDEPGAH